MEEPAPDHSPAILHRAPRRADHSDLDEVVRITNAAYRVEDFFVDGDRTNAADITERMLAPSGAFLVIDGATPGTLVGSVYVTVSDGHGHFALLSVDPAQQGRGLGRTLVAAVERHCLEAGCKDLYLDFVNLREELPPFYARLGFAETGETLPMPSHERLRRPAHLVQMWKPLVGGTPGR